MSLPEKRRRLTKWLHGEGIEIGALHNPLEVPAGARVTYVDHLPVERLRELGTAMARNAYGRYLLRILDEPDGH